MKSSITTAADVIDDVIQDVGVDSDDLAARLAVDLAEAVTFTTWTSGKTAVGVAASCLYVASLLADQHITQADITESVDTSAMTIRDNYPDIPGVALENDVDVRDDDMVPRLISWAKMEGDETGDIQKFSQTSSTGGDWSFTHVRSKSNGGDA